LTGQIGLVSGFFDKLHDPYMLAAFLALLAAGGVGLWLVITGRLNIAKIVEQLSGSD
jgi:hypothetical protein